MSAAGVVLLGRGAFGLIIGGMLAYMIYTRYDRELRSQEDYERRFLPIVPPTLLPELLLILLLLSLLAPDWALPPEYLLKTLPGVFLQIAVYYALLLALLPLLRRWISARAVAVLWVLPNYLYVLYYRWAEPPMPALVWRADGTALRIVFWVWLAGFGGVMLWKIVSHLRFRRRVLKHARPVTDPETLDLWKWAQSVTFVKKPVYHLVISPDVSTPLSVGLWRRTIRVVLPDRAYTKEELSLIFRHELAHIRHEDTQAKLFLAFCTAMCWFNPLMWRAMRRCAEDLELSCDELILENEADTERRRYAELLLTTAGDERGFTTCLSADAAALRYRLNGVVHPSKRRVGGLVVGLAFFLMILGGDYAALAYDPVSARDAVFGGDPAGVDYASSYVTLRDGWSGTMESVRCLDPEGLKAYIAGLELYQLTGNYGYVTEDTTAATVFQDAEGAFGVSLGEHFLLVTNLHSGGKQRGYYLYEPLDWNYVNSILSPMAEE